jgi:hypothetical protein
MRLKSRRFASAPRSSAVKLRCPPVWVVHGLASPSVTSLA